MVVSYLQIIPDKQSAKQRMCINVTRILSLYFAPLRILSIIRRILKGASCNSYLSVSPSVQKVRSNSAKRYIRSKLISNIYHIILN